MDLIVNRTITDDLTQTLELAEEYDRTFGLYDHSNETDLYSVIYLHPEEDPVTGSRLENLALELITLRVPELTNEGLTQLLTYPRWFLERLIKKVRPLRDKERQAMEDLKPPPT